MFGKIRPVDEAEKRAIREGGAKAGALLDAMGKTDLAQLTPAQWDEFCRTLFVETCEALRREADDSIPF